jgi:hypothetical protein
MTRYRLPNGEEVEKGHYSSYRTERGNAQVARLRGKSNLQIARNMISLQNLHKHTHAKRKWHGTEELVLEREKA